MSLIDILFIAIALAIDAFAVAFTAGSYFGKTTGRQKFRLSFHFGLFQFLMPIIGWFAGRNITELIKEFDHWIAFGLLLLVGIKMIKEAFNTKEIKTDITRGLMLVNLSIATSIDALAVGFIIGIDNSEIVLPSIIIGLVCSSLTLVGIFLGERLSFFFGRKIGILGGVILIIIGIRILIEHLLS